MKKGEEKVHTVIIPFHKEVAVGTFSSILRQAGKTREAFQKLLN